MDVWQHPDQRCRVLIKIVLFPYGKTYKKRFALHPSGMVSSYFHMSNRKNQEIHYDLFISIIFPSYQHQRADGQRCHFKTRKNMIGVTRLPYLNYFKFRITWVERTSNKEILIGLDVAKTGSHTPYNYKAEKLWPHQERQWFEEVDIRRHSVREREKGHPHRM